MTQTCQSYEDPLGALLSLTGLNLCLKTFDSGRSFDTQAGMAQSIQWVHTSDFCTQVKRTRNAKCIECDLRKVPALALKKRKPFIRECHAGASELIVPIVLDDQLAAVAYLGQFRRYGRQPASLPTRNRQEQMQLLNLAQLVRSFLAEHLSKPRFPRPTSPGHRSEVIEAFLRKNLRTNPSLSQLAVHLGISPARAAHAVREATGRSFTELRDSPRLERAQNLLRSTFYKISQVAADSGFSSSHYFHRFFLRNTGLTPAAFRRQHRPEV